MAPARAGSVVLAGAAERRRGAPLVRRADRPLRRRSTADRSPGCPRPQRSALEVALLRAEPSRAPQGPQAIALGVLNVLRALAARRRCWWRSTTCSGSTRLRRTRSRSPRGGSWASPSSSCSPGAPVAGPRSSRRSSGSELERLEVGPLSLDATRRLLADRLGLNLPRPVLRARSSTRRSATRCSRSRSGARSLERGLPESARTCRCRMRSSELLGTRVGAAAGPDAPALLAVALSGDAAAWAS